MYDLDFSGSNVLVVGGSSGIGNAIALAFRDRGAEVCVTGTRKSPTEYAGERGIFEKLQYRQLDASDRAAVETFRLPFDGLSVLINSQGIAPSPDKDPYDLDVFERVVQVNLKSMMYTCTRFRRELAASRGSIISIGSAASYVADPTHPSYSAAKGGMLTLIKSLAAAWAAEGIRVNGIAPGYTDTRMGEVIKTDPEYHERTIGYVPMRRWASPAEQAGVALFLASPLASYVVGQMILVDGGLTL